MRGLRYEFLVRDLRSDRPADHHAGRRVTVVGRHAEPRSRRANQLHTCTGTDLAHEFPVRRQAGTAADALAAVFPPESVSRLHDTERHRTDADFRPFDVELFGDEHRQRGTHALADLGLIAADDDVAVGLDLDKESQLTLVGRVRRKSHGGHAENEAPGGASAADQELAAAEFGCGRVHLPAPLISAAR